jgi:hypothetical protein
MKKAFFLVMALVTLVPVQKEAKGCDSYLIHEEGSQVTYDSLSGRHWYYNLTTFKDKTYDEQRAEITRIRVPGFPGRWHMATYEEMEELWFHSAEAIFFSFALTRDDPDHDQQYATGRYNERYDPYKHYIADVRLEGGTYQKSQLNYLDAWADSDSFDMLGAWVIYEDGSSAGPASPAAKMLPAIMLLLSDPNRSQSPAPSPALNRRPF